MATLHIEHSITDLQTWLGAFTRFEEASAEASPALSGTPTARVLTDVSTVA
jgi:hypothetical protein